MKDLEVLCYFLNEENGNVFFIEDINIDNDEKIRLILKDIGVKFVDILLWVCCSIENIGIIIIKFNLDSLISYLKFFLCYIKLVIEKDKFLELKNLLLKIFDYVKLCIKFCMKSENFSNEIEGLLFCLLESENIVIFSVE